MREGKNQEDFIRSKMVLLCEPDASGLLVDLLCTFGGYDLLWLRPTVAPVGHRRSEGVITAK